MDDVELSGRDRSVVDGGEGRWTREDFNTVALAGAALGIAATPDTER